MNTSTIQAVSFLQCIPAKQAEKLQTLYWRHCQSELRRGIIPPSPDQWLTDRFKNKAVKNRKLRTPSQVASIRRRFETVVRGVK